MLKLLNHLIDLGEITEGEVLQKSFMIHNDSTEPVVINTINASCGCTTTQKYENITLSPKETFTVKFGFNSSGKRGNIIKNINVIFTHNNKQERLAQKFKVTINPKK